MARDLKPHEHQPDAEPEISEKHAPTLQVGNSVWFVPFTDSAEGHHGDRLPAIVCKVNEDGSANLCVFTAEGRPVSHQTIPFVKQDEDAPASDFCCLTNTEGKRPVQKKDKK
jgi:hypothetical protein